MGKKDKSETSLDMTDSSLVKEKKKKKKKSVDGVAPVAPVAAVTPMETEETKETKTQAVNGIKKEETEPVDKYEELLRFLSPISKPLASKKLTKKLYKLVRKSGKEKGMVRRGIREAMKYIRKGETGLVVLAGDVSPIDVITHVPFLCEEKRLPYCFTPSKLELGEALGSKRPSCMVLIKSSTDSAVKDIYDDCLDKVKSLPLPI